MDIPMIQQLQISDEERQTTATQVKSLLTIYRKKLFDRVNMQRLYNEWVVIATRINKGQSMLDSKTGTSDYLIQLFDLYKLQLKLLGMYELCFKQYLTTEQYEDAQLKIYKIVSGK